jgi:hypothetical protein
MYLLNFKLLRSPKSSINEDLEIEKLKRNCDLRATTI